MLNAVAIAGEGLGESALTLGRRRGLVISQELSWWADLEERVVGTVVFAPSLNSCRNCTQRNRELLWRNREFWRGNTRYSLVKP